MDTADAPARFATAIVKAQKTRFEADRVLNIRPDPPDFRDRFYQPGLVQIEPTRDVPKWISEALRDQGDEGSCTGHALAAVIDLQNAMRGVIVTKKSRASARMLYEMARSHDEYPDDGLEGSSARGAIKGFFHNGVCTEETGPYRPWHPGWRLKVEQAKEARNLSLGAYFRLRHVLYDYHAALCEAGAISVTAMVHEDWSREAVEANGGKIPFKSARASKLEGGHAFAIVGYDADGFLILNSWGENWGGYNGHPGVAHWDYEDWQAHVLDAWVLRLAVPSAKTFHKVGGYDRRHVRSELAAAPARSDLIGHYCHVEDGRFVSTGNYPCDAQQFDESAKYIYSIATQPPDVRYDHILLYAHGGLTELASATKYASVMIPMLKALKIYPVFFFWRTGAMGAITDILLGQSNRAAARAGELTDISDWLLEKAARVLVRPIWSEMKGDAARGAFKPGAGAPRVSNLVGHAGDATLPFVEIVQALSGGPNQVGLHVAGHSAGAILVCNLLERWAQEGKFGGAKPLPLSTASFFAPACTPSLYKRAFGDLFGKTDIAHYVLNDERERDDTTGPYRKSILYLVSNVLEEKTNADILGLEKFALDAGKQQGVKTYVAGRDKETDSPNHGDYDKDPATLNHMLTRILGKPINAENGGFSPIHFDLGPTRHGS